MEFFNSFVIQQKSIMLHKLPLKNYLLFLCVFSYKFYKTSSYAYFVATVKQIKQHLDDWKVWDAERFHLKEGANHNTYCTNRICRDSPLTAELLLSVINLCWLLSPLPITCCVPLWLALCQQLFLPEWRERGLHNTCRSLFECGCMSCVPACVSCICMHFYITFCLLSQGPPGMAGTHGDKVSVLSL